MLTGESLLPVPTAVERVTGQRPHPTTCHRWRLRGINGVILETVRCGGRRLTSVEAVQRFIDAGTRAVDGANAPAIRTNRQRETAIDRAEAELAATGF